VQLNVSVFTFVLYRQRTDVYPLHPYMLLLEYARNRSKWQTNIFQESSVGLLRNVIHDICLSLVCRLLSSVSVCRRPSIRLDESKHFKIKICTTELETQLSMAKNEIWDVYLLDKYVRYRPAICDVMLVEVRTSALHSRRSIDANSPTQICKSSLRLLYINVFTKHFRCAYFSK
jgi:hypothetical protein